jgi:hypothetical protein
MSSLRILTFVIGLFMRIIFALHYYLFRVYFVIGIVAVIADIFAVDNEYIDDLTIHIHVLLSCIFC